MLVRSPGQLPPKSRGVVVGAGFPEIPSLAPFSDPVHLDFYPVMLLSDADIGVMYALK
jgi:hypothetical protein